MSESTLEFEARFADQESAQHACNILQQVQQALDSSEEDIALHHVLTQLGVALEVDFDSWWYPQNVEVNHNILKAEFSGSPSGTDEQDIVTWIKRSGAVKVQGKAFIDTGADVFELEF